MRPTLGSVEDAEGLVQETFLRAWRSLAGFEGRSTLRKRVLRFAESTQRRTMALSLSAVVGARWSRAGTFHDTTLFSAFGLPEALPAVS